MGAGKRGKGPVTAGLTGAMPVGDASTAAAPIEDVTASEITATETAAEEAPVPATSEARVDHWFDRQLVNLYGEVADEPVPDEILALINKLKSPH